MATRIGVSRIARRRRSAPLAVVSLASRLAGVSSPLSVVRRGGTGDSVASVSVGRTALLSRWPSFGTFLSRQFHSTAPSQSSHGGYSQIKQDDFTEMAWEGIVRAMGIAAESNQQIVESEHLMKALLEQKDGLARRIFTEAGIDNTLVLQTTDQFISKQPKVTGDTSGPVMGSSIGGLFDIAKKHKKDLGDEFLSVEHFLLALHSDKRFGQQLFKSIQLDEKVLKDAVLAVRGNQRVTDHNPEGKYQALQKYGNDLTELARRGKLDPVIGRDDEIRRCIQILSRRTKNNPVIIGEPGVGKTAIAEGLAQRIVRGDVPEPLLNRKELPVEQWMPATC